MSQPHKSGGYSKEIVDFICRTTGTDSSRELSMKFGGAPSSSTIRRIRDTAMDHERASAFSRTEHNRSIALHSPRTFGSAERAVLTEVLTQHPVCETKHLRSFFLTRAKERIPNSRFARTVSLRTIRRQRARCAAFLVNLPKPELDIPHRIARMNYIRPFIQDLQVLSLPVPASDYHPFDDIIFLDEKQFVLTDASHLPKGEWVTDLRFGPYARAFRPTNFGHHTIWVEILGAFSAKFTSSMLLISSSDNPIKQTFLTYMQHLKQIVSEADAAYGGRGNYRLIQDGCGGHYSEAWDVFKETMFPGVVFLPHPSLSPDLNLAEIYWLYMESRLRQRQLDLIETTDEWVNQVFQAYCEAGNLKWWPLMRIWLASNMAEIWNLEGGNQFNEKRCYRNLKRNLPPAALTYERETPEDLLDS